MNKPLYDMEIMIPFSSHGRYKDRCFYFKKYGLLNIRNKKILIKAVMGNNDAIPNIEQGWPPGVEVEAVICPYKNENLGSANQKIYHYYYSLTNNNISKARWFAKFDDDSMTDVYELLKNLDENYNHEKEYYIATQLCPHRHAIELDILRKMGHHNLANHHPLYHEWEGCIISQAALKQIINNEKAMRFIAKRRDVPHGPADMGISTAAYLSKITVSDAYFMTKAPDLANFSFFGKHMNHIHEIMYDKNENLFHAARKLIDNRPFVLKNKLYNKLKSKEFYFYRHEDELIGNIKLNPKGAIENNRHHNEVFWTVEGNKLQFLTIEGLPSTIFYEKDDYFEGRLLLDPNIVHTLKYNKKKLFV